jgi:hypothetical protein
LYNKQHVNLIPTNALGGNESCDSKKSCSEIQQQPVTVSSTSLTFVGASDVSLLSPMSLAYMGGFFDGEGCIHLAKQTFRDPNRRATFRMRVDLSQNNLEMLQAFQLEVGVPGNLHALKRTLSQNRQCYKILYDGDSAFEVLRRLLPYLRRKKPEAIVALEYQQSCAIHIHPGRRGIDPDDWALRARFYRKLRAMK